MSKTSLSKYDIQNSDSFWAENINILFQTDRLSEFIPLDNMSYNEKLNSIVRFSIYLSLLLFILKGNSIFFYIPIFICVLTYFLNKNYISNQNYYESFYYREDNNKRKMKNKKKPLKFCQLPSNNNPFMNVLQTDIKYRPKRPPACKINKNIKEDIEDKFNSNLYRNISDIYGKTNSQRQYYTMPSTTIPNDQESFSKWLYSSPESCKDGNSEQCVSNIYNNILADTPFKFRYIN